MHSSISAVRIRDPTESILIFLGKPGHSRLASLSLDFRIRRSRGVLTADKMCNRTVQGDPKCSL